MAVLRALALAWMVHRTAAVTTTLANCESACNLGEMLCLNKNASSTLCSAVQGACMAGCYAHHVDCGCADASVTHCEEIKLQAPHTNDAGTRSRRPLYNGAERHYRKAIALDPKIPGPHWDLSLLLENQKNDIFGAVKLMEEYVNLGGVPGWNDGKSRLAELCAALVVTTQ